MSDAVPVMPRLDVPSVVGNPLAKRAVRSERLMRAQAVMTKQPSGKSMRKTAVRGKRTLTVRHVRAPGESRWLSKLDALTLVAPRRSLDIRVRRRGKQSVLKLRHGDIALIPQAAEGEYAFGGMDALVATVPHNVIRAVLKIMHRPRHGVLLFGEVRRIRDPLLATLLAELWDEVEHGEPSGAQYSQAIGLSLVVRIVKRYGGGATEARVWGVSRSDERIRRTLAYLEARLTEKVTLADTARESGLSVAHLLAVFKEATGETISAYLRRRRLQKAHELLRQPSLTIAEVAEQVGYASTSYFATAFKAAFGMSPGEWRRPRRN